MQNAKKGKPGKVAESKRSTRENVQGKIVRQR